MNAAVKVYRVKDKPIKQVYGTSEEIEKQRVENEEFEAKHREALRKLDTINERTLYTLNTIADITLTAPAATHVQKSLASRLKKQLDREDSKTFNLWRFAFMYPFGNPSRSEITNYIQQRNAKIPETVTRLWNAKSLAPRLADKMSDSLNSFYEYWKNR